MSFDTPPLAGDEVQNYKAKFKIKKLLNLTVEF